MKKLVYLFFIALTFFTESISAQSFTIDHDTVKSVLKGFTEGYNYIRRTTGTSGSVDWRIISNTMPQGWIDYASFGLCDNVTCYSSSILDGTTTQTTDTFGSGSNNKCLFKIQFSGDTSAVMPGGPYYVKAEITSGTQKDTITFQMNKWATGIQASIGNKSENVRVFPNPADDFINVSFNREMDISDISLYNIVGKKVLSTRTTDNKVLLDISGLTPGIYFVQLNDNKGNILCNKRFVCL